MVKLFLIIMGVLMLGDGMGILGLISLIVGFVASRPTAKTVTIVVSVLLLFSGWFLAGVIGLLLALFED